MGKLTPKQQQIYDFISSFADEHGYPPSVREIAQAVNLKSPATVHFHLKGLREAGYISQAEGKTRAITIVGGEAAGRKDQVPLVGYVAAGAPILAQEVVVHQQPLARNGDIVVALFEDEATVKTFRRERDGHIWLYPENSSPEYQPIDGEGCSILGRVVAVIRRY